MKQYRYFFLLAVFLVTTTQTCFAKWVSYGVNRQVTATRIWTPIPGGMGAPYFKGKSGNYWTGGLSVHANGAISVDPGHGQEGWLKAGYSIDYTRRIFWVSPNNSCTICPTPPTDFSRSGDAGAEWNMAAAAGIGGGNTATIKFSGTAAINAFDDYGVKNHYGDTTWGSGPSGDTITAYAEPNTNGTEAPNIGSQSATMFLYPDVKCTVQFQALYIAQFDIRVANPIPLQPFTTFDPQAHGMGNVHGPAL